MQNRLIDAREEKPLQKADKGKSHPRMLRANRQQIEMRMAALDSLVPEDHKVRIIWEMAQEYDLSKLYDYIDAIEGEAGRPAIDPLILVVLWLYATTEGVGSARPRSPYREFHEVHFFGYTWFREPPLPTFFVKRIHGLHWRNCCSFYFILLVAVSGRFF